MKAIFVITLVVFLFTSSKALSWGSIFGSGSESKQLSSRGAQRRDVSHSREKQQHGRLGTDNERENLSEKKDSLPEDGILEKAVSENSAIDAASLKQTHHSHSSAHDMDPDSDSPEKRSSFGKTARSGESSMFTKSEASAARANEERNGHDEPYPSIAKEIRDIAKPIGPSVMSGAQESTKTDVEKAGHAVLGPESHSTLTKGIEQAIAGLTSVYNTLRSSNNSSGEVHDLDKVLNPEAEKSSSLENSTGLHVSSSVPGEGVQSDDGSRQLSPSSIVGGSPNSSTPTNISEGSRAAATSAASSTDKKSTESAKTSGGISTFTILGGVALIAAIGIFLIGYSQDQSAASPPTPLYPPKGPAYV